MTRFERDAFSTLRAVSRLSAHVHSSVHCTHQLTPSRLSVELILLHALLAHLEVGRVEELLGARRVGGLLRRLRRQGRVHAARPRLGREVLGEAAARLLLEVGRRARLEPRQLLEPQFCKQMEKGMVSAGALHQPPIRKKEKARLPIPRRESNHQTNGIKIMAAVGAA